MSSSGKDTTDYRVAIGVGCGYRWQGHHTALYPKATGRNQMDPVADSLVATGVRPLK